MDYWLKQERNKPLFDKVLWNKPERRDQAGAMTIVGGANSGFIGVANAYKTAQSTGIGQVTVIMPDSLSVKFPPVIRQTIQQLEFTDSTVSGGLALKSERTIANSASNSGNLLLIGDVGANAETAQLIERLLNNPELMDVKITLARDAVDLIYNGAEAIMNRHNINIIVSLAQLQKLARAIYFPRMIGFSQGIRQIVETLHKLTLSYHATITLFSGDHLLVSQSGKVISQTFSAPMRLWSGEVPARIATWQVWHDDLLEATATSWTEL